MVDRCWNNSGGRPPRAHARLVLLATVALLVAGCSSNRDNSPTAPADEADPSSTVTTTIKLTPSSDATSTTTANPPREPGSVGQSVEEEIVARYIAYWDARFAANSGTPNPEDPALREYATGEQLTTVVAETQANLDQGLALRRATNPSGIQRVTVIEVESDRAAVQECVVTDGVIIRRDSGEVVNDDVATHNVRGELQRVDGVWRVSSARLVQRWEGVAGCALDS